MPLLRNALEAEASCATQYRFAEGAGGQRPVLPTVPSEENFPPAIQAVVPAGRIWGVDAWVVCRWPTLRRWPFEHGTATKGRCHP